MGAGARQLAHPRRSAPTKTRTTSGRAPSAPASRCAPSSTTRVLCGDGRRRGPAARRRSSSSRRPTPRCSRRSRSRRCRATRPRSGCAAWCASFSAVRTPTSCRARRCSCMRGRTEPEAPWSRRSRERARRARRHRGPLGAALGVRPGAACRRSTRRPTRRRARTMVARRFGPFFAGPVGRRLVSAAGPRCGRPAGGAAQASRSIGTSSSRRRPGRARRSRSSTSSSSSSSSADVPLDQLLVRHLHREGDQRAPRRGSARSSRSSDRGEGRPATPTTVRDGRLLDARRRRAPEARARAPRLRRRDDRDDPRVLPARPPRERVRERPPLRGANRSTGARRSRASLRDALRRDVAARPDARAVARGGAAARLVDAADRGSPLEVRARRAPSSLRSSTRPRWRARSRRCPWSTWRDRDPRRRDQSVGSAREHRATRSATPCLRGLARRRCAHASGATSLATWSTRRRSTSREAARRRFPARPPRPGRGCDRVSRGRRARAPDAPVPRGARARRSSAARAASSSRTKREAGRYDFDDMLSLVDDALARSARRGARRGDAPALALRAHRRVPGHRRDAVVDLPPRLLRAVRAAHAERRLFSSATRSSRSTASAGPTWTPTSAAATRSRAPAARASRLDRNYRATPRARRRDERALRPRRRRSRSSPARSGTTPVACGRPDRALVDGAGRALSPGARHASSRRAVDRRRSAPCIAREIRAATSDPARPWRFDGKPLELHDVFVLTRTAREGRIVGRRLARAPASPPRVLQGGRPLPDRRGARDLLAPLAAIDDPDDRARRLAAWLTPFFGLPLAAVERARELPPAHPLLARLRSWKALADAREFERLFESIVRDSGVVRREIFFADGEREAHQLPPPHRAPPRARARRPRDAARPGRTSSRGSSPRRGFPLDLEGNVQRLESERRAVQIMTIHKVEGARGAARLRGRRPAAPRSDEARVYHEGGRRLAWVGNRRRR